MSQSACHYENKPPLSLVSPTGTLLLIGGHEDKEGERRILKEFADAVANKPGTVVIVTVASGDPRPLAQEYLDVFSNLGVEKLEVLDIRNRGDACEAENIQKLRGAAAVFFTGGDQLRITSQIGDTPILQAIHALYAAGGVVAGTSAGAAAMPETMVLAGPGEVSHETRNLSMAAGLGLLPGMTTDSHFTQRGRIGRLLGAVAQNPRILGLGLDEDTAVVAHGNRLRVLGSGAAYFIDGSTIAYSSLSEKDTEGIVSIHELTMHVLGDGHAFDLSSRRPCVPKSAGSAGG